MVPATSVHGEGLRHSVRLESPTAVGFLGLDPFLKTNAAPKPSRFHYLAAKPMCCSQNVGQKRPWCWWPILAEINQYFSEINKVVSCSAVLPSNEMAA
ncbi:hypothetical protein V6N13_002626 [Hibiscus sabdariffa]|uniref:Uncharacterized protein n=1 Tax=Hibiscus sabdariffa TaxID=183260 RepID=A0ABR2BFS7_9ROSI